jgi:hypothetical protein
MPADARPEADEISAPTLCVHVCRWVHHAALEAMVRTCTACGAELHVVGMDAWNDPSRKVAP